jgi:hypothetical protein
VGLALLRYWRALNTDETVAKSTFTADDVATLAVQLALHSEDDLHRQWLNVQSRVRDAKIKGKALEAFIARYAQRDADLQVSDMNLRTMSEEIDLVLENVGRDELFNEIGSRLLLIECKYQSAKTTAEEIRNFAAKVKSRHRLLCKVGIIVSMSGLTKDAEIEMMRQNGGDVIIGAISGAEIGHGISEGIAFKNSSEKLFWRLRSARSTSRTIPMAGGLRSINEKSQ